MMPRAVIVETMDKFDGIWIPQLCCPEQHDICLVEGHGRETEAVGQVALPFQIGSRAGDEQTARVLVHVRALRII